MIIHRNRRSEVIHILVNWFLTKNNNNNSGNSQLINHDRPGLLIQDSSFSLICSINRTNVLEETCLVIPSLDSCSVKYHGFGNGNNTDHRDSIVTSNVQSGQSFKWFYRDATNTSHEFGLKKSCKTCLVWHIPTQTSEQRYPVFRGIWKQMQLTASMKPIYTCYLKSLYPFLVSFGLIFKSCSIFWHVYNPLSVGGCYWKANHICLYVASTEFNTLVFVRL